MLLNTLNATFNANVTSHMCNRNNLQNLPFDTIIFISDKKKGKLNKINLATKLF